MFMPKLGIMHLRNRLFSFRVAAGLFVVSSLIAAELVFTDSAKGQASSAPPPQNAPGASAPNSTQQPATPQSGPTVSQPAQAAPTQTPSNQAPANQGSNGPAAGQPAPGQGQGTAPDANDNGVFVFKAEAREVVLHATVVDDKNHLVMNLDKPDFTIFENDKPQQISSFRQQDFPVAMGIVIDLSLIHI